MDFLRLPFFDSIRDAKTILLAGAGGGYDIFAGLPLYFGLRSAGKTVHLANLSFSKLYASNGRRIGEALVEVDHKTEGPLRYFPEIFLGRWFREKRKEVIPIYCFDRTSVRPITTAYRNLVAHLSDVDAVVLIDGGTDSLMRGDEPFLGTPQEDIASLCAVDALDTVATKLLLCVGFGVDTFHGVCHAYFLEAVADLIHNNAYLGAWSLTNDMSEVTLYRDAVESVHAQMFNNPSIVSSSILSAIEGRFGDYHATFRTSGNQLFINPLMSLYWSFRLEGVMARNLYREMVRDTETYQDITDRIARFRATMPHPQREWVHLPM